ncbi:hypothetical protein J4Q44_G00356540 [Coregonus suidteri]|uniref:Uncharacterized protein n=1 Tax=Coregonus suidteri TaxID=861788 RepID=A0AAN8QEB2_9TELE
MQNTFALRRQTIVMSCPPVKELMDLWPALHMQSEELHDVHTRRTTVLHALPDYLLEEVSGFFRTCVDDMDEPDLGDASVVLLTTVSDDATSPVHYHPVRVSVVLEGDVVVNLPRLADAFLVMFGLIYALHLSYPKGLTNTFEFTQKILLGLDDSKLSPKLQTLKNELMLYV